jgi:hypothetical protein
MARPEMPAHVQKELSSTLRELRGYCKNKTTLREILDGEDDTKTARAVLNGANGDEIIWSLGYLNALADVYKCDPTDLM